MTQPNHREINQVVYTEEELLKFLRVNEVELVREMTSYGITDTSGAALFNMNLGSLNQLRKIEQWIHDSSVEKRQEKDFM